MNGDAPAVRGVSWLRPLVRGGLARRDGELTELMDDPDCDPERLRLTYAQFGIINAVFSGWRSVYRQRIRPMLSTTVPSRILDLGSGGGDLTRLLAVWARRDGLRVAVTGADPDERASAFAAGREAVPGLSFRRAWSRELVAAGERYDLVVSNHMLHHLDPRSFGALLADSERLAPRAIHADITRSAFAYAGFGMVTWPFFRGSFIREDGLRSVRRSHTPGELAGVLPAGWSVEACGPLRYVVVRGGRG